MVFLSWIEMSRIAPYVPYIIMIFLMAYGIVILKRGYSGEVSLLWGLVHIREDKKIIDLTRQCESKITDIKDQYESKIAIKRDQYENLMKQVNEININSQVKSNTIKMLKTVYECTVEVFDARARPDFKKYCDRFYEFTLTAIVSILSSRENMHRVTIFKPDKSKKLLLPFKYAGFKYGNINMVRLPINGSIAGHVYTEGKGYCTGKVSDDEHFYRLPGNKEDYESLVCVPIDYNGLILGVLSVDGITENSFTDDDVYYISCFALPIAFAIILQSERGKKGSL